MRLRPRTRLTTTGPTGADEAAPSDHRSVAAAVAEVLEHDEDETRPEPAGPLTNVVTALLVLSLGAAAVLGSLQLGAGTPGRPGPGTWPLVIGVLVTALGLVLLLLTRRSRDAERFPRQSWGVVVGIVTMLFFLLAVPRIGFEIPAALLCLVWLRFLGREGWRTSVVISLGTVAAFYTIFVVALSVPVPHLF